MFYYPTAIEYEDRKLKLLFPETWDEWASVTPALMPKMDLKGTFNGKIFSQLDLRSWSLKKSLVTNYEPVIVIYVIAWLIVIVIVANQENESIEPSFIESVEKALRDDKALVKSYEGNQGILFKLNLGGKNYLIKRANKSNVFLRYFNQKSSQSRIRNIQQT
ncbi:MAG: hypothetical protein CM1200mP17_12020 [Woeseia sp.]|nr:MAG: hypothetical protein CM1200mP17_12020 [Woeseia sp.]